MKLLLFVFTVLQGFFAKFAVPQENYFNKNEVFKLPESLWKKLFEEGFDESSAKIIADQFDDNLFYLRNLSILGLNCMCPITMFTPFKDGAGDFFLLFYKPLTMVIQSVKTEGIFDFFKEYARFKVFLPPEAQDKLELFLLAKKDNFFNNKESLTKELKGMVELFLNLESYVIGKTQPVKGEFSFERKISLPRSMENFPKGVFQEMVKSIKAHLANIGPRRSFLFLGPPGVGKTFFVQTLARELKIKIKVVNCEGRSIEEIIGSGDGDITKPGELVKAILDTKGETTFIVMDEVMKLVNAEEKFKAFFLKLLEGNTEEFFSVNLGLKVSLRNVVFILLDNHDNLDPALTQRLKKFFFKGYDIRTKEKIVFDSIIPRLMKDYGYTFMLSAHDQILIKQIIAAVQDEGMRKIEKILLLLLREKSEIVAKKKTAFEIDFLKLARES